MVRIHALMVEDFRNQLPMFGKGWCWVLSGILTGYCGDFYFLVSPDSSLLPSEGKQKKISENLSQYIANMVKR